MRHTMNITQHDNRNILNHLNHDLHLNGIYLLDLLTRHRHISMHVKPDNGSACTTQSLLYTPLRLKGTHQGVKHATLGLRNANVGPLNANVGITRTFSRHKSLHIRLAHAHHRHDNTAKRHTNANVNHNGQNHRHLSAINGLTDATVNHDGAIKRLRRLTHVRTTQIRVSNGVRQRTSGLPTVGLGVLGVNHGNMISNTTKGRRMNGLHIKTINDGHNTLDLGVIYLNVLGLANGLGRMIVNVVTANVIIVLFSLRLRNRLTTLTHRVLNISVTTVRLMYRNSIPQRLDILIRVTLMSGILRSLTHGNGQPTIIH